MARDDKENRRKIIIVTAYPFGVLLVSVVLNLFVFGVKPLTLAMPSVEIIFSVVIAAFLLVINHTWLMTSTELTRGRFNMHATPEEWVASGNKYQNVPEEGLRELERRHNTHRNTTENVVYFIFLVFIFVLVSPTTLAAQAWVIGFPVARIGYTYSYLAGNTSARGLFMSISLLALYGITSYLLISLVV